MRALSVTMSTLAVLITIWASPAVACEAGYCVRSTVPADGATNVPTDAKIFVFYNTTPGLGEPETGMSLFEGSGQGVLSSVEVFPGENPMAEVRNQVAVLTPFAALSPNTEYEVSFPMGAVCGEATLTFTTGSGTTTQPTFTSATSVTADCIEQPTELTSCNDQEPYPRLKFELTAADTPDAAAFAIYRNATRIAMVPTLPAVAQLVIDDAENEECFVLRAVAQNGTEVGTGEDVCVSTTDVCATSTLDMGGGPVDMGADMPQTVDMAMNDQGTESDSGQDMDMVNPTMPDDGEDSGCGCSSGPAGSATSVLLLLVALLCMRRLRWS